MPGLETPPVPRREHDQILTSRMPQTTNADRHVEHLKLDAVEQVLAVPIKDPLAAVVSVMRAEPDPLVRSPQAVPYRPIYGMRAT